MKVIEGKRKDLEKKASNIIELEIKKLLKEKKSIVFGIVGGKSIVGILKQIKNSDIEWNKVHIFMVDERRVSLKNKESNFKIVNEFLLNYLIKNKKIKKKNIHPYHYSTPIKKYSNELKKHGGKFDIIILSSGEDGHIAGLFPNSTIKNKSNYFITFNNSPKYPKKRISASKKLLEKSNVAILLFFGNNKKEAYKKFNEKRISILECPAKLVRKIKRTYVLRAS